MNLTEKQVLNGIIRLVKRENHRKALKKARNKRYYQKHRADILARERIKNELYRELVKRVSV